MLTFKEVMLHQKILNKERLARAKIIEKMIGEKTPEEITRAIDEGFRELSKMSREQIICKFIDATDAMMLGLFKNEEQE